ncbi:CdaR family transcriptional regulator [Paenarthrobacter aurescens]|uniref:PucR family transcriptional regulator n=1 Tax=Paenarthrobacter aurescens TaxID=43663 RepID=A0A4Y3NJA4_PAEAU|nr:helix-turn-helix domain-containing protein [Paenarthrobacter aurescens]MDO6142013.1 helix-turn-helix domain-containing protein [Paenarthrobacter aurescens]MDO6145818.1 helix-turn-helix domain-containing protein [Paenarthrobacter aurescens]MDO6157062.1 helix-turn-helix domain-containing protein [Paenarthrobacter aurescens]MDO6161048.1 helix-turn-helix domain-containing protein [Paenarthrobacter aurescens]GEB19226.1 PucR family transcriptional regulator [Paenarthrobacter aurescens]
MDTAASLPEAQQAELSQSGMQQSTVRLSDCIQLMQADLVHANPTPENLGHPVSDVLMYDPLDNWSSVDNRIILAVGCTYGSPDFDQLLHRAANSNAAAVIVKAHGAKMEQLRSAAVGYSLSVLVAPDNADWTRLVALARASVMGAAADSVSGVRLGDLYAFANAAASITNGAASIVDPLGRILGYSTLPGQPIDELRRITTLTLQETTQPAFDQDFRIVYAAPGAVMVPALDDGMARLALAVRAGGELLGSIWIIDPGEEKRATALNALDRMAPLAGLHMLHARSASDFGERRNADLIRTLMEDTPHASFAAAQLGLDTANGLAVAAFSIVRPETGSLESVRDIHRLLHLVTTVCNVQFGTSHSALIGSVVYALLPCNGASPRAVHGRIIQEIEAYSHTISPFPVIATVGGIASDIENLPRSRSEAIQTLHYLRKKVQGVGKVQGVALYEDFQIPLNLLKIGGFIEDNGMGGADEIARIQARDAEQQTDYLETLRAYLASNGNISAMAAQLHVHNNTVRYRVTRLAGDFNLDLADPQKRLWLWLRLTTMDLASK